MALTKITRSLLNTGVSDSSDATAITIDSNERVGIGQASPTSLLHLTSGNRDLNFTLADSPASGDAGVQITAGASDFLGIFAGSSNGELLLGSNGAEKMRIDATGNVGIGTSTTTNDAKLIVVGSDGKHPCIKGNDGGANGFTLLADNYTATESQLNLGVGFSSSSVVLSRSVKPSDSSEDVFLSSQAQYAAKPVAIVLDDDGAFKVLNTNTSATTAVDSAVSLSESMSVSSTGILSITHSATAHTNGLDIINSQAGGYGSAVSFQSERSDNNVITDAARIRTEGANSWNSDSTTESSLIFEVSNNNSLSESMRLLKNGDVIIGGTTAGAAGALSIQPDNDDGAAVITFNRNSTSATSDPIRFKNGGSTVGQIAYNGSEVTYSTTSDYRLKENIVPMKKGLERVKKLKPVKFNWKEDGSSSEGFIAHEIQEAGWEVGVEGQKDGEEMQMVEYGKLTPLLVKAIQEQQKEIEELKQNSHPPKTIEEMEGYEDLINRIKELENK